MSWERPQDSLCEMVETGWEHLESSRDWGEASTGENKGEKTIDVDQASLQKRNSVQGFRKDRGKREKGSRIKERNIHIKILGARAKMLVWSQKVQQSRGGSALEAGSRSSGRNGKVTPVRLLPMRQRSLLVYWRRSNKENRKAIHGGFRDGARRQ